MVAGNFNLLSFYLPDYLIRNFNNKITNPAPEQVRYGAGPSSRTFGFATGQVKLW
jgi:hypothetical protein